jgi:cytoskeletal protein RodZ
MFEIGSALRDARTRQGLDLAQCEARTRIRAKYLRAMEDERFELLPAAAYVKGFLRSYGESLGLDGQILVDEYTLRFEPRPEPAPAAHELAPMGPALRTGRIWPKGRGPRSFRRSETQLLWLAIGGAIAVGLLVWIGADDGQRATPIPAPPSAQTAPVTTPQAPPATAAGTPAPATGAATPVTLSATGVHGTNGSYLQVRRGGPNGPVIFEDTVPAGSTKTFHGSRRLWVRVGWTPGIRLMVGGRPATTAVGTLNFLVTPKGLKPA